MFEHAIFTSVRRAAADPCPLPTHNRFNQVQEAIEDRVNEVHDPFGHFYDRVAQVSEAKNIHARKGTPLWKKY